MLCDCLHSTLLCLQLMGLTFTRTVISVLALMDARSVPIDDAWVTSQLVSLLTYMYKFFIDELIFSNFR